MATHGRNLVSNLLLVRGKHDVKVGIFVLLMHVRHHVFKSGLCVEVLCIVVYQIYDMM